MTHRTTSGRVRRLVPLALFLAAVAVSALASTTDVLPGVSGEVGRVLAVLLVIALGVRALWWLGVDGHRPDMARIMSDRADARQARR